MDNNEYVLVWSHPIGGPRYLKDWDVMEGVEYSDDLEDAKLFPSVAAATRFLIHRTYMAGNRNGEFNSALRVARLEVEITETRHAVVV